MKKYTKNKCIKILKEKYELIKLNGETRFPKKSDFLDEEVNAIKSFLGAWPRALEAAGVKEPRNDDKKNRNLEKRIRLKRKAYEKKDQ